MFHFVHGDRHWGIYVQREGVTWRHTPTPPPQYSQTSKKAYSKADRDQFWTSILQFASRYRNSAQHNHSWEATSSSASQHKHALYVTRKFISVFTTARHLFLFWAKQIQPLKTHCYLPLYPLVCRVVSFLQVSPPKFFMNFYSPPYMSRAPKTQVDENTPKENREKVVAVGNTSDNQTKAA